MNSNPLSITRNNSSKYFFITKSLINNDINTNSNNGYWDNLTYRSFSKNNNNLNNNNKISKSNSLSDLTSLQNYLNSLKEEKINNSKNQIINLLNNNNNNILKRSNSNSSLNSFSNKNIPSRKCYFQEEIKKILNKEKAIPTNNKNILDGDKNRNYCKEITTKYIRYLKDIERKNKFKDNTSINNNKASTNQSNTNFYNEICELGNLIKTPNNCSSELNKLKVKLINISNI